MGLAALSSVIWGLGFVAIKIGLGSFSAPQLTAVRFVVAGLEPGVRTEDPRLDRVEDLGDPQFAEVLRIVESVEPTLMDR